MNTAALKTFAPAVRRQLMEAVTRKLDFVLSAQTPDYLSTFAPQVASLRKLAQADRTGLIERVAYTWFNRFAALRFVDARGWHPFRARVLTPASPGETQPELLKVTRTGALPAELHAHTDPARLNDLLDGRIPSSDPQGEVYRLLVLAACRFYHALLPNLFERLDDETELLLPDDLLTEHSVAEGFRKNITDEDCAEVEILGWLYQFYISERKDQVMARKSAVLTEDIPAVTQLFTPHWIVRYLVENSLGRLWLLNRPGSRLREHMPYYIEGDPETEFLKITRPEEIRLCDPAVGSGHMLTYAFDLLTLIYEEEGYAPTEIPGLILRHNLHGLEICPRAAQLAELALVFKAREKSRRFFQPEHLVRPDIIELREVRFVENELRDYIRALGLGDLFHQPVLKLLHQFEAAKNFGSLIQPCLDERALADVRRATEAKDLGGQLFLRETHLKVLRVLEQAEALSQRYHVVVANPPYLGRRQLNGQLSTFSQEQYPESKADLFSMFIERGFTLVSSRGFNAMVTMQSWMFLSSFTEFREALLRQRTILTMTHMGNMVMGIAFGTAATVWVNACAPKHRGRFCHVEMADVGDDGTPVQFPPKNQRNSKAGEANGWSFAVAGESFVKIPEFSVAYWLSDAFLSLYDKKTLDEFADPRQGLATGNNERFLRFWYEVGFGALESSCTSLAESRSSRAKWFPVTKGGAFRRWYGNRDYVLAFDQENYDLLAQSGNHLPSRQFYFKEGATWSTISSGPVSFRYIANSIFETKGSICFPRQNTSVLYLLGSLNSKVTLGLLGASTPTIDYHEGPLRRIPFLLSPHKSDVEHLVRELVSIAQDDWDNFETSWDFRAQPLLRPGLKGATLESSWRNWEAQSTAAVRRMQELETENNRLFIAAYGLDGELQPEVPEAQITLARADARRDMAAFLSYAVGCMMGRYSPDHPGLILANAGDSLREFLEKVGKPLAELAFTPDEDGIIPVLDGEWFEDDIVARTRDFLRATFGEATLRENLRFIEDSLGTDLRSYFTGTFYKDHLQTYKKRPIYWMVQSPKKGFQCLLYLHRYTRDTMNLVLNRYLRDYQAKLRNRLAHLTEQEATAASAKEKTAARKEADKLKKILHECDEWERQTVLPLAQARIELDLDDGVKVNYLKLGEALAPIAGLAAKEEE